MCIRTYGCNLPVLLVLALIMASSIACIGTERVMVVYNAEGRTSPGRELSLYDVEVNSFQGEKLDGFRSALSNARMLYIGQYAGGAARANVFGTPERRQAIGDFLAGGGTLFIDYNGLAGGKYKTFFDEIGLQHPGRKKGEYYPVALVPDAEHPILSEPHKITGDLDRAYGWWTDWGPSFTCPIFHEDDPGKAAMLVVDDVAGKGTVIVNQVYSIFRDESGVAKDLFENVLSYAFGSLPGPGEAVPVYDPYKRREPPANRCYLARARQAPWHVEGAHSRIPIVIGEPVGLRRQPACVSMRFALPEDATSDAVRVFTRGGNELPSQARIVDADDRVCEVLSLIDFKPHQQRLLYIYFGAEAADGSASRPLLYAERSDDGFELRNDRLRIVLDPSVPEPRVIAPLGAAVDNELAVWRGIDRGTCNHIKYRQDKDEEYRASITEDGPVRKTVTYSGPDLTIRYSLIAGSNTLFYEIRAKKSSGVSRFTGWAPGGDGTGDTMWYESEDGLKRAVLRTGEFYRPFDDILPYMKEGWLAFEDERGEVVGELFDLEQTSYVKPYVHSAHGHTSRVSNQLQDGRMTGAFVAARGDHSAVRKGYLGWKNPPGVLIGQPHGPEVAPQPTVPEFGRDYLRMIGNMHWFLATTTLTEPERVAHRFIRWVVAHDGNYVIASDRHPEYIEPLIRNAHEAGVGVILKPLAFRGRERLCPLAEHDAYVQGARDVAAYNPDGFYLVDEFQFPGNCEQCRKAFKKQYDMAMPDKLDFDRLDEPAMHNWMLFKIDVINDLIRDMTKAVRKQVPDAFVFHVTSPNNHYRLEGYHDLATQSQWMTTTNSDLYSTNLDATRYMLAHIRGAQGNDRPVFTVNGCMYEADDIALNFRHHLMYGSNALWYFAFTFNRMYPNAAGACHDGFRMLRDTGLGRTLAASRPVPYAAVLRSRAGWMACLKRGDKSGRLLDYERRIRRRVLMSNIPTEILFSRHFSVNTLNRYSVLIVPSEPVIEPEIAKGIADWVRDGGNVVVEGEAVRNETLADLCGVTVTDRIDGPVNLTGTAEPLADLSQQFSSAYLNVTAAEGSVLAQTGDRPAVTLREVGDGRACYLSLLDAPSQLARPLVLHLGGPPPVTVPEEYERDIEVSALTDGSHSVVAVYNRHISEPRAVDLMLNDIPGAGTGNARAIDMDRGTVSEHDDNLSVKVEPGEVNLYLLASPEEYPLPEAGQSAAIDATDHSMHPGTEFLRLEPEQTRSSARPEKDPSKLYVAVLKNLRSPLEGCDIGAQPIVTTLKKRDDLVVEYVEDINASKLSRYGVFIVPNMGTNSPAPNLSDGWETEVRKFVENGVGALLVHHSVGYMPVSQPIFPEIAKAPDYVPVTAMEIATDHSVATGQALRDRYPDRADNPAFAAYLEATAMSAGDQFQSGFADYIKLIPGAKGTPVVVSKRQDNLGGDATVVAGKVGAGRVVLSGLNIGCHTAKSDEGYEYIRKINEAEASLLTNAVYWLGAE